MKRLSILLMPVLILSCGGGSSSGDDSGSPMDGILSHPVIGQWITSCVSSELVYVQVAGSEEMEPYWIQVELDITEKTVVQRYYEYDDANCEIPSNDSPLSPGLLDVDINRIDNLTTSDGYSYGGYVAGTGAGEFYAVNLAIIDAIPYYVGFDSGLSGNQAVVLFDFYLTTR